MTTSSIRAIEGVLKKKLVTEAVTTTPQRLDENIFGFGTDKNTQDSEARNTEAALKEKSRRSVGKTETHHKFGDTAVLSPEKGEKINATQAHKNLVKAGMVHVHTTKHATGGETHHFMKQNKDGTTTVTSLHFDNESDPNHKRMLLGHQTIVKAGNSAHEAVKRHESLVSN